MEYKKMIDEIEVVANQLEKQRGNFAAIAKHIGVDTSWPSVFLRDWQTSDFGYKRFCRLREALRILEKEGSLDVIREYQRQAARVKESAQAHGNQQT